MRPHRSLAGSSSHHPRRCCTAPRRPWRSSCDRRVRCTSRERSRSVADRPWAGCRSTQSASPLPHHGPHARLRQACPPGPRPSHCVRATAHNPLGARRDHAHRGDARASCALPDPRWRDLRANRSRGDPHHPINWSRSHAASWSDRQARASCHAPSAPPVRCDPGRCACPPRSRRPCPPTTTARDRPPGCADRSGRAGGSMCGLLASGGSTHVWCRSRYGLHEPVRIGSRCADPLPPVLALRSAPPASWSPDRSPATDGSPAQARCCPPARAR